MSDQSTTSATLLARLRKDDNEFAWRDFVARYGRRIYDWCVARRLQPSDAEDVTQEVLVRLAKRLRSFDYDPEQSFRGYLRRITQNALADFFSDQKKRVDGPQIDLSAELENAEARADLLNRLSQVFDMEVLDLAKRRVQARVESRRWEAWHRTAVQQIPGEDVAAQLDMKLPTVYSARYQVQRLISEEVRLIGDGDE